MDSNGGHFLGSGRPTLPPTSTRTLHHPSLLPFHLSYTHQTVRPFVPSECFYSDPTLRPGWRVPNTLTGWGVLNCVRLNTPPPVMSASLAPPNVPDPFRWAPHLIRDLGSLTTETNIGRHAWKPRPIIIQLTEEEDQAVTNLLTLHHHQEPVWLEADDPQRNAGLRGRLWSGVELEAANTLLSRFGLEEKGKIWRQDPDTPPEAPPDPPEYQTQGSQASIKSNTDPFSSPLLFSSEAKGGFKVCGGFSGVEEGRLSDSEGVAVEVLLSLGDMVLQANMQ